MANAQQWVEDALAGNKRALARLLTLVENEQPDKRAVLTALFPYTGRAWVIGVTGAPGTGKSSLVNALTKAYRARGKTVAILAVDPTSPFTGGAILGDRIRMYDHFGDAGVFIRSMATRGSLGGLARATRDAVRVMDAVGFDLILVETVGSGQNEVDIVQAAYTTLVVEAPGLGDDVQAIKAGILEIADVLVVNKADRPGAAQTVRALRAMLELGHPAARDQFARHHNQLMAIPATPVAAAPTAEDWIPPVIQTTATDGSGIEELIAAVEAHQAYAERSGQIARLQARFIELEVYDRLQRALMERFMQTLPAMAVANVLEQIQTRTLDPQSAVDYLLTQAGGA